MSLKAAIAFLLVLGAAGYGLLGRRLVARARVPGSLALGLSFMAIGIWVLGGAIENLASDYRVFLLGRLGHFIGTALVPVGLLACFRDYTGAHTGRLVIAGLLVVPTVSILVAASNGWHELMWLLPPTNAEGDFLTRPAGWGPWFAYVHAPYSYSIVGVAVLTLLLHASAVAPLHRRAMMMLAASAAVPIVAAALYDLGIGPNTISTLPIVFLLMLPVYAWLIIGARVIERAPLAYETVFQNMQDPVIVVDERHRIVSLNHPAETMLKVSEDAVHNIPIDTVFGEDVQEVYRAIDTGQPQNMLTNTGRFLHLQVTPIEARLSGARILMFRDVSDVQKAAEEIRSSEALLRKFIERSVNGILRLRWIGDEADSRTLKCIFANSAAGRFLRAGADDIVGKTVAELVELAAQGMPAAQRRELLGDFMKCAESGAVLDTETRVGSKQSAQWFRIIVEPVGENIVVTLVDVTDRKARELHMESMASSDPLTGVLNRRGFEREASQRLKESGDSSTGALLYVDLNEFKQVNDRYGHETGDHLLIIAAERIRTALRDRDVIGRPGGDEFVALVPDVDADTAGELAARLTQTLQGPYLVGKETLTCAASIGLALYPVNADTLTGLLRAADQAMYRAKVRCRGASVVSQNDLLEMAG